MGEVSLPWAVPPCVVRESQRYQTGFLSPRIHLTTHGQMSPVSLPRQTRYFGHIKERAANAAEGSARLPKGVRRLLWASVKLGPPPQKKKSNLHL